MEAGEATPTPAQRLLVIVGNGLPEKWAGWGTAVDRPLRRAGRRVARAASSTVDVLLSGAVRRACAVTVVWPTREPAESRAAVEAAHRSSKRPVLLLVDEAARFTELRLLCVRGPRACAPR